MSDCALFIERVLCELKTATTYTDKSTCTIWKFDAVDVAMGHGEVLPMQDVVADDVAIYGGCCRCGNRMQAWTLMLYLWRVL